MGSHVQVSRLNIIIILFEKNTFLSHPFVIGILINDPFRGISCRLFSLEQDFFIPKGTPATWAYCTSMNSQLDSECLTISIFLWLFPLSTCSKQISSRSNCVQEHHIQRLFGWTPHPTRHFSSVDKAILKYFQSSPYPVISPLWGLRMSFLAGFVLKNWVKCVRF